MLDKMQDNNGKSPVYKMMYKDLVKNPLPEVKKMYQYFNIPYTDATESYLKSYIDNDPKKKKYGAHKYTMDEYGISVERLKREFAVYDKFMSEFTDKVI